MSREAPVAGDVLCDLTRIAALLDVHPQTPKTWRKRGVLPDPDDRIGRSDVWWQSNIERWWTNRHANNQER